MRPGPRRNGRSFASLSGVMLAAFTVGLAGCASLKATDPGMPAAQIYRSLLGHNPGLTGARAVVEARIRFAGREVSLPGVLLLDPLQGFRLELLDPLDRPLAILFSEDGRIVQYRPGQRSAAALGLFPARCRGVDPADWVAAVTASSLAPVAGDVLADRGMWRDERVLERRRSGQVRQSVRYRITESRMIPRIVMWYCDEEPVLQVRMSEWLTGVGWQLPAHIEVDYPQAGLSVVLGLREVESNPPPTDRPFRPRLGTDISWTSWNLPR